MPISLAEVAGLRSGARALSSSLTFDTVIVGGGVAGVNCAHAFAKKGQKVSGGQNITPEITKV